MIFYFSLGISSLVLGASFRKGRSFDNVFKYAFYLSILTIFFILFYQSFEQYRVWSENPVSQYLLPPHQGIGYFIFYVGIRFFGSYLISLTAAFLLWGAMKKVNQTYEERFFCREEYRLAALGMFLSGFPGFLFYIALLIIVYLTCHLSLVISQWSRSERVSTYYLWLPIAIFVIIIQKWLQALPLWQILKI